MCCIGCTSRENDNTYTLLVRREGNDNIWHKLMELWQSVVTLDALQMAVKSSNKAWLPSAELPNVQVVFEDNRKDVWDDALWGMVTGSEPLHLQEITDSRCLGNVILPLAGSSSPFWASHWGARDCSTNFMLDPFLARVYEHMGIERRQRLTEETTVTIIDRQKTRRIMDLQKYLPSVQARYPNITIRAVDFASISLREQIVLMRETDVLVGVIGAGMTHSMFLPKESAVAEIFPPKFKYHGFRNMAKMRGLSYFSIHADKKENYVEPETKDPLQPDGTSPASTPEKKVDEREERFGKRYDWQSNQIYLTEEAFVALLDAAITSQFQRGLRSTDVLGQA
jgi:protein O-GlcNAc transferase